MPELPEVETVKRTLTELIVGKQVADVIITLPRIIQRPSDLEEFRQQLLGTTIQRIERRGKFLKIYFDGWVLVSHLRMEGKYRVEDASEPPAKHTHVRFRFSDRSELRYLDVRQFGTMHLFKAGEEETSKPLDRLGPEPLTKAFTLENFRSRMVKRKTNIKALLLNQSFVAGLGNIYVDEALHHAKIHPERGVATLSEEEQEKLYDSIQSTIKKAIAVGGSSVRSYVDGNGEMGMFQLQIQVYGRKEEPCYQCGTPITRTVVAGRGTHYCSNCQKV
ncbi:DNA-formamidopyrimidine glycosylase [Mechercharimyces sp. CAU 1602]|uniref:DNA-formamidopyrimidine glycosylase n=1 Tax=Mechercharimyces sp. CAU 1602 TaxID=2973933 RepID=UPI002163D4F2|nr:DNA-formamidopyrimidine glycosylase [Mechercharimyces sp. CAU 1602]MCS1351593.1 DNA-formamidopyrimidine glycosylase [Mechercharimyces sp. CAU 1602]